MNNPWKSFEVFPDYEVLTESSSHYYNGVLKIVVAMTSRSFRLIELHALDDKMSLMTVGFFGICSNDDKEVFPLIEHISDEILKNLDEYELKKIKEEEWCDEPDKKHRWCLLSELHAFLEDSVV